MKFLQRIQFPKSVIPKGTAFSELLKGEIFFVRVALGMFTIAILASILTSQWILTLMLLSLSSFLFISIFYKNRWLNIKWWCVISIYVVSIDNEKQMAYVNELDVNDYVPAPQWLVRNHFVCLRYKEDYLAMLMYGE